MGFFKKKADPISERARTLNQQIAALEAEIKRLSSQPSRQNDAQEIKPSAPPAQQNPDSRAASSGQPRLRSTALPHGHGGATMHAAHQSQAVPPAREGVLEDVNPFRNHPELAKSAAEQAAELGVRKSEGPSLWQRIRNSFRAAPVSNPKLVNYLAAGSIHGLRPLRYEKRVARNRFLLLVVVLALILWGLLAAFLKR